MADEKITPGAPPAALTESPRYTVNKELDEREAHARKAFETSHTELFPDPAAPPAAAVPDAAEAPAELPTEPVESDAPPIEAPSVHPEEAPAPPAAVSPAPAISPESAAPPEERGNFDWRKYRQLEREKRKLEKQVADLQKPSAVAAPEVPAPAVPAVAPEIQPPSAYDENDPFGVKAAAREEANRVRREQQAEWEQQRAEDQERQELVNIDRAEREFAAKQPDYYDAVTHLANYERSRYQRTGMAQVEAQKMMNDPQWAQAIERVADNYVFIPDPNRPNHLLTAERTKLTAEQMAGAREMTDGDAAVCLATERWIQARRHDVLAGARVTGRPVPEIVWEVATQDLGYKPRAVAPAANGGIAPAAGNQSVAERVRQSARATAAGKSLSSVSGAPTDGTVAQQQIKTLRDYMELRNRDPQAARAYNERMQKVDPAWHTRLAP